jgi:hypothetical protein
MSWTPTGTPSSAASNGRLIAGCPVTFQRRTSALKRVASSVSPARERNAATGDGSRVSVGVIRTRFTDQAAIAPARKPADVRGVVAGDPVAERRGPVRRREALGRSEQILDGQLAAELEAANSFRDPRVSTS